MFGHVLCYVNSKSSLYYFTCMIVTKYNSFTSRNPKDKTNTYIKLILDSWYDLIAPKEINKPS